MFSDFILLLTHEYYTGLSSFKIIMKKFSHSKIFPGTSTMLTFITLSSKVKYSIPKVPYIVASEIWFLGCMIFIFAAMIEFGIVNTIYRRK